MPLQVQRLTYRHMAGVAEPRLRPGSGFLEQWPWVFPCCLSGHLCPWSAGDAQWAGLEFQRLRGSPCSLLGPFTGQPNSPPARPSGPVSSAGISQGDLEVMPGEAWHGHVEHRPVTQLLWRSPQDRLVRPLWLHCQHCGCVVPLIGATVAPGCARRVGLSARAHLGLPGPSATSLPPFLVAGALGGPYFQHSSAPWGLRGSRCHLLEKWAEFQ